MRREARQQFRVLRQLITAGNEDDVLDLISSMQGAATSPVICTCECRKTAEAKSGVPRSARLGIGGGRLDQRRLARGETSVRPSIAMAAITASTATAFWNPACTIPTPSDLLGGFGRVMAEPRLTTAEVNGDRNTHRHSHHGSRKRWVRLQTRDHVRAQHYASPRTGQLLHLSRDAVPLSAAISSAREAVVEQSPLPATMGLKARPKAQPATPTRMITGAQIKAARLLLGWGLPSLLSALSYPQPSFTGRRALTASRPSLCTRQRLFETRWSGSVSSSRTATCRE